MKSRNSQNIPLAQEETEDEQNIPLTAQNLIHHLIDSNNIGGAIDCCVQYIKSVGITSEIDSIFRAILESEGYTKLAAEYFIESSRCGLESKGNILHEINEEFRQNLNHDGSTKSTEQHNALILKYIEAYNILGAHQMDVEDFVGATKSFERVTGVDPSNAIANSNLALLLYCNDKIYGSIDHYIKAIENNPNLAGRLSKLFTKLAPYILKINENYRGIESKSVVLPTKHQAGHRDIESKIVVLPTKHQAGHRDIESKIVVLPTKHQAGHRDIESKIVVLPTKHQAGHRDIESKSIALPTKHQAEKCYTNHFNEMHSNYHFNDQNHFANCLLGYYDQESSDKLS